MAKVAAIQMTSVDSVERNLEVVAKLVKQAADEKADLIVLPENVAFIGKKDEDKFSVAEEAGKGPIQIFMARIAKQYDIWLVAGTIPIRGQDGKVFASCWMWDNHGQVVARYDKIHLFDVTLNEREQYCESKTILAGNNIVCVGSPLGKIGLTVCYDLRFPELYRKLLQQGMELTTVVSAFTAVTGAAHWETLLRARAIENLCYVIAPNQTGNHVNGRASFGHTMIIDPWGKILDCLDKGEGVVMAEIDLNYLVELRHRFPVIKHQKNL